MMSPVLGPETRAFYRRTVDMLRAAAVPFLVGGAYAFERYTGIARHTKDFDVFVHPRDFDGVLALLAGGGCQTEVPFPHWLGKARRGEDFVDVIWSSGNGIATVDDDWFRHSVEAEVFGAPVQLIPAEEMIWSKAFIMERERYDGADVAHILRAEVESLDWERLQRRFGEHWRVLLSHLIVFGFVYPCERHRVPATVMKELLARLDRELSEPGGGRVCRGTLISRAQYLIDVETWGYEDPRVAPAGNMTAAERERWTAAIDDDGPGGLEGRRLIV